MQRCILVIVLAIVGLSTASRSSALGLGEIMLNSSLNKPLSADIQLLQVRDLTANEVIVRLASREDFQRAGVERTSFLDNITFSVDLSDRSRPLIRLRSKTLVTEPYLNFLLEIQWPSGRLLREYTLLMDLPVFDSGGVANTVTAPSTENSTEKRDQATVAPPAPATSDAAPAGATATALPPVRPEEYRTVEGDTLWAIARRAIADHSTAGRPVTVQQSMLAIQRVNPEAFIDGNINLLRTGAVLRFPDKTEMQQLSARQAITEVDYQNRQWSTREADTGAVLRGDAKASQPDNNSPSKPEGRLKLSAIDSTASGTAKVAGAGGTGQSLQDELIVAQEELDRAKQENVDLLQRVGQLEDQIETMEKLIAVSNDKLRALQLAAAEKSEADAVAEASPVTDTAGDLDPEAITPIQDADVAATAPADTALAEATEAASADSEAVTATSDATPVEQTNVEQIQIEQAPVEQTTIEPSTAPVTPPSASATDGAQEPVAEPAVKPERGIIPWIKENTPYIGGVVIALLLLILLLRFRNRDGDLDPDMIEEELPDDDQLEHQQPIAEQFSQKQDSPIIDDTIGLEDQPLEDAVSDGVDVLDKSNIFISLGQYDQAANLLLREIEANPDNTHARLNLLKVYAETQDINEFDAQYAQLLPLGDIASNEKAKELRAKIPNAGEFDVGHYVPTEHAPEAHLGEEPVQPLINDELDTDYNPLSSADLTAADERGSSLDLDVDISDLDQMPTLDQEDKTPPHRAANSDRGDDDNGDENHREDLDYWDASLTSETDGDPEGEAIGVSHNDNIHSEHSGDMEDGHVDRALAEREDEHHGSTTVAVEPPSTQQAIDIQAIDAQDVDLLQDNDIEIGSTDELAAIENVSLDTTDLDLTIDNEGDPNVSNSIDFSTDSGFDLDSHTASESLPTGDNADDSAVTDDSKQILGQPVEDVDMVSLDREIGSMLDKQSQGTDSQSKDEGTQQSDVDDDLTLFDDDTDQVATKLGLAEAYLDMGDFEGARDILNEVEEEGTFEQQDQARKMLNRL